MLRRESLQTLLAAGASALALPPTLALAQDTAPVEGKHFVRLSTPMPVSLAADKKVDVVEFFSYGCGHCFAFEPVLENWVKKLPADVAFRQVPVPFLPNHQVYQRMHYALEEVGQLGAVHRKIFSAIHQGGKSFTTDADAIAFVKSVGVDEAKFSAALKSFNVNTKMARAKQLTEGYKIDSVPTLGVNGRFFTSGTLAGSNDRAVAVADFLIQRVRTGT